MQYEYKDFSEIKPYDDNPRNNEPAIEAVANSLREFGWRQPVVLDKDGVIVAGHTRWLAAQRLLEETGDEKWRMIPVHIAADLTEEQATAYRLADNKTAELAIWDDMKLEGELAKIAESEIDMSLFGFDEDLLEIDDVKAQEHIKQNILSFPGGKVIMTDEENERLTKRLRDYIDTNGVAFGFISEVLDG